MNTNNECIELSVVIPAYNEVERLPRYLGAVIDYLDGSGFSQIEVIVVDDGSIDATAEVAQGAGNRSDRIKVIRLEQNQGKGFAIRTGMLAAKGRLRLFADADGATPIGEIQKLKAAIDSGADIAIASRALKDTSRSVDSRLSRKIMGTCFNLLVRALAVPGIRDTQCGFKLFKGEVADHLFKIQLIPGFGFDPEVLFLAHKCSYVTMEVPVNWRDVAGSKVNVVKDSLRMLSDLLRIRIAWCVGQYRNLDV
jgi:dolichyl-phosphate beta-glucosyltransferase